MSKRKNSDRRRALRQRESASRGFIWCDGLLTPRACTLQDISTTGVRIELIDGEIKPQFMQKGVRLYIANEKHEIDCRVAWTSGKEMGLAFIGRPHAPTRTYR